MTYLLFLVLFAFLCLPPTVSAKTIDLKVKGVEIGTSYSAVVRKLGKPLSRRKGGSFPCDEGNPMLTLRYSGLVVKLIEGSGGRNFSVASMEVTSPKWITSGITVGASIKDVLRMFGQNNELIKEKGLKTLPYFIKDGYANFYFRNKRLVKMAWELNVC